MKSNEINELAKGLILFHVKCEGIKKDAKNPFFKSTYASLPKIIEAITEPLAESGLALTMFPVDENSIYCLLMHTSGQWIDATYTMKPVKDTPQDKGSCITYARRYCISSILNLQIDDILADDDGNKASEQAKNKKEFFKEPQGQMKNLSNIASEELKASAEEQRLNKLKEALSKMQSAQEIQDYLAKKYQGKTRLEILQSMSEANAEKAMAFIADANNDLWMDQEENEDEIAVEGEANE